VPRGGGGGGVRTLRVGYGRPWSIVHWLIMTDWSRRPLGPPGGHVLPPYNRDPWCLLEGHVLPPQNRGPLMTLLAYNLVRTVCPASAHTPQAVNIELSPVTDTSCLLNQIIYLINRQYSCKMCLKAVTIQYFPTAIGDSLYWYSHALMTSATRFNTLSYYWHGHYKYWIVTGFRRFPLLN